MVAHACDPSSLGDCDRRITWTQEVEFAVSQNCATALHLGDRARLCFKKSKGGRGGQKTGGLAWQNPISTKSTKISQAWWYVPAVPATQEAEAGELLEPGRRRFQWGEIMPLHSCLGNRARFSLKKKKKSTIFMPLISFPTFHFLGEHLFF